MLPICYNPVKHKPYAKNPAGDSLIMEIYKDKDADPNKQEPTIRYRDSGHEE